MNPAEHQEVAPRDPFCPAYCPSASLSHHWTCSGSCLLPVFHLAVAFSCYCFAGVLRMFWMLSLAIGSIACIFSQLWLPSFFLCEASVINRSSPLEYSWLKQFYNWCLVLFQSCLRPFPPQSQGYKAILLYCLLKLLELCLLHFICSPRV